MATVKTRIQLKSDTEANWNRATNFCPLRGEVIIYLTDELHPFFRIKIGDGTTYVRDLPFFTGQSNAFDVIIDTTEHLNMRTHFIPEQGVLIIYTDKSTITDDYGRQIVVPGFKVGDSLTYLIDLPFIGDEIVSELRAHTLNTDIHVTAAEKTFWNNKLNYDTIIDEELILSRN